MEARSRSDRSHVEIYQAVLDADVERTRALLGDHVSYARESLLGVVKNA